MSSPFDKFFEEAERNPAYHRELATLAKERKMSHTLGHLKMIGVALLYAATFYAIVACATFRFSHPWMTETELFLHVPEALSFQTVPRE